MSCCVWVSEQAKVARTVVLHDEPPVHKHALDNGPTLFHLPYDGSSGFREFIKAIKRAACQVNPDGVDSEGSITIISYSHC